MKAFFGQSGRIKRAAFKLVTGFAALILSACAPLLGADAPLFAPTAETGPAPFAEGVWAQETSTCAERRLEARYSSADCTSFELSRLGDGAWRLAVSHPPLGAHQDPVRITLRVVLSPAAAQTSEDAPAPLYIAEFVEIGENGPSRPSYVAVAPTGEAPARAFSLIPILCSDALSDPPIAGLSALRNGEGEIMSCTAEASTAVREAAHRATIAHLNHIGLIRFTWRRRTPYASPDLLVDCPQAGPAATVASCDTP